jgi:hypothetical protein
MCSNEEMRQGPIRRSKHRRDAAVPQSHPYEIAGYELFVCLCVCLFTYPERNRQTYSHSGPLEAADAWSLRGMSEAILDVAASSAASSSFPATVALLEMPAFPAQVAVLEVSASSAASSSFPAGVAALLIPAAVVDLLIPASVQDQRIPQAEEDQRIPEAVEDQSMPKAVEDQVLPEALEDKSIPSAVEDQRNPEDQEMDARKKDEKKKGWDDRGNWERPEKWVLVRDAYCRTCSHHHYCHAGVTKDKKEKAEEEKKEKQKSVDSADMNEDEKKDAKDEKKDDGDEKMDANDEKMDAKDEEKDAKEVKQGGEYVKNEGGWRSTWSDQEWEEWEAAKAKKKANEALKKSIFDNTLGKVMVKELTLDRCGQ